MTKQQIERTKQALNETHEMLARANSYSASVRNHELVAFCESHIVKLNAMLANAK